MTRDGGGHWTDIRANVKLPGPRWVATIEPSRYVDGRAYVAFDAHRSNDEEPYVYVTEDYGQAWKSIRSNLPIGSARVCREDIQNPDLLYVGTEFAAWVSANRGVSWTKLNNNLPTVAIHELAQHPTSGELVAATHGRSLWVLDVTPLRQMTATVLKDKVHLYQPNPVVRWRLEQGREGMFAGAERKFVGQNPPPGAQVYYALTHKAESAALKIMDHTGKQVAELTAETAPGLHRANWALTQGRSRRGPGAARPAEQGTPGAGGQGAQGGAGRPGAAAAAGQRPPVPVPEPQQETPELPSFFGGAQQIKPGVYRVVLTVDGKEHSQWLRIEGDPAETTMVIATDDDEEP